MPDTPDDVLARAKAALDRAAERRLDPGAPPVRRPKLQRNLAAKVAQIAIADAAILIVAAVVGWFLPLGMFGALAVMVLLVAVTLLIALAPTERAVAPERLRSAPLRNLPRQTARWLDAQRPALPAPAVKLADQIGVRLEMLNTQLMQLDDDAPAALEARKLIGEQLPEFVKGYQRVPETLRSVPRNGKTPDAELTDGLRVIEQEIAEMTERLAAGDLDSLATRGRYLEMKYKDEG